MRFVAMVIGVMVTVAMQMGSLSQSDSVGTSTQLMDVDSMTSQVRTIP